MDWIKQLPKTKVRSTLDSDIAFVYGLFIQRLGFSSGGFPQDIRLYNLDTEKMVRFRVKRTFKSSKKNTFCYEIPPGNYAITHYWWTKSTWYGGKIFTEPVLKDSSSLTKAEYGEGKISPNVAKYFTFSIKPGTLNYVGTWHFNTEEVSFTDDKEELDNKLVRRFKRLDFTAAYTVIPT